MILGFFIDGDSIEKLAEEIIKKYGIDEILKRNIMTLILSFDEQRYCGDCVNSKWEGGCESSINGPAEPGYHYCGLSDEEKEELEQIGDYLECYELGDCDASDCHNFKEKDLKEQLKETIGEHPSLWTEDEFRFNSAKILNLKRRIAEKEL